MREQPMIVNFVLVLMLVSVVVEWALLLSGEPLWEEAVPIGMFLCGFLVGWGGKGLKGGE